MPSTGTPGRGDSTPLPRQTLASCAPARAGQPSLLAHWLLAASATPARARAEWADSGTTWLQPGALFTAVAIRASLLEQAVGRPGPLECAPLLAVELDGPVFYRPHEFGPEAGYTVLLPASATQVCRVRGTVVVPQAALVLVPAPDKCEPAEDGPWWVAPPDGVGTLCTPALLASLLARPTSTALEEDSRA